MKKIIVVIFLFCIGLAAPCQASNMNVDTFFDEDFINLKMKDYTKDLLLSSENYTKSAYEKFLEKKYKSALIDSSKAIELNPKEFLAYTLRGLCECKLNKYEQAVADCAKAIELNPNEYFIYCLKSICEFKTKDYISAIKDCNVALTFNEDMDFIYSIRALNEFKLKDYKNSISDCEKAIEINQNCYLAYFIRGLNKTEIDDFKGALKDYSTGIKLEKSIKNVKGTNLNEESVRKIPVSEIKKENSNDKVGKIDFGPYMKGLQRQIKVYWFPPKMNSTQKVVVIFNISKDGKMEDLKIFKSSGDKSVDEAAIVAVKRAQPFKPLPEGFNGKFVKIMFTFDYNVFFGEKPQQVENNTKSHVGQ